MELWVQLTDLGSALDGHYKQIKMNLIKLNLFISTLTLQYMLNVISGKVISKLWTFKELRKTHVPLQTSCFFDLGIQTVAGATVRAEEGPPGHTSGNSQRSLDFHAADNSNIICPI